MNDFVQHWPVGVAGVVLGLFVVTLIMLGARKPPK